MSGRGPRCSTGCSRRRPRRRPCSASTSASRRRSPSAANICRAKPTCPPTPRPSGPMSTRLRDDEDLGAASFLEQRPPPPFLFRRRRRREARLPAPPRLRARVQRHRRRQGLDRSTTRSAPPRSPRRASPACGCSTGWTARVPVWPMDPLARAQAAWSSKSTPASSSGWPDLSGRKVRSRDQLDAALAALGSRPAALAHEPERPRDRRADRARRACARSPPSRPIGARPRSPPTGAHRRLDLRSRIIPQLVRQVFSMT